jgi:methylated-DNA-protein-cysteine methyltransferase related protein
MRPPDDADRVVRPGFHARVYGLVRQVPAGRVTTYGDVASALGSPRVARHVGFALAALRDDDVPWQRVINARGTISFRGDTARGELQRRLLEAEGVRFDPAGRVPLAALRFRAFTPDPGYEPGSETE